MRQPSAGAASGGVGLAGLGDQLRHLPQRLGRLVLRVLPLGERVHPRHESGRQVVRCRVTVDLAAGEPFLAYVYVAEPSVERLAPLVARHGVCAYPQALERKPEGGPWRPFPAGRGSPYCAPTRSAATSAACPPSTRCERRARTQNSCCSAPNGTRGGYRAGPARSAGWWRCRTWSTRRGSSWTGRAPNGSTWRCSCMAAASRATRWSARWAPG